MDEECDLDELQALLEDEEELQEDVSQKMDDFLQQSSDSEDEKIETPKEQKTEKKSVHKANEGTSSTKEKKDDDMANTQSENEILKSQMAEMQKQMMEMQKMLMNQLQQNQSPPEIKPKKVFQENCKGSTSEKHEKPAYKNTVKSPVSNTPKSSVKSFKLVDDKEVNMFFEESAKKPESGTKTVNSAKKSKVSSETKSIKSSEKKKSTNATAKALFGDSDSDWDELDGEDKKFLSEEGKDIKRILNSGERKREAHTPKYSLKEGPFQTSQTWSSLSQRDEEAPAPRVSKPKEKVDKHSLQCGSSSTEQKAAKSSAAVEQEEKFVTEDFSRIRIINPLVSSYMMRQRMEGRKMIGISKIHQKLKTADVQGDWVTIGVVVSKSEAKSSKSGKSYSIWKLNDLDDLDNSVSFFLFGEVFKTHWKLEAGTVVGVLNPSIMDSMEKNNSEPAFTIKSPNQLMVMGRSKDLSWCKGKTKKGNKCSHFINLKFGEFCAYHVQAEYRRTSSKRLELHGSIAGVKPKSFEKKVFSKDCAYFYGGQTFVPNSSNDKKKAKKDLTLDKLKQAVPKTKINTLTIQEIKAGADKSSGKSPANFNPASNSRLTDISDSTFVDMVSVPTPGSMNFVAFLKKKEQKDSAGHNSPSTKSDHKNLQSITPNQLLKEHKQRMRERMAERKAAKAQISTTVTVNPLKEKPVLGKGFYNGDEVCLDVKRTNSAMSVAELAKLKAVAKIKASGGLKIEDPNAVKKSTDVSVIKKRVQHDTEKSSSDEQSSSPSTSRGSSSTSSGKSKKSSLEPPMKKSRLLGNVDMNSDEIKAILKARSKHQGALTEAELEREEVYFNALEKKERMEEKMQQVMSIDVNLYTCKQCNYSAQKVNESCKKEGHPITKVKAKKRFFVCKKCKNRTAVVADKYPTEVCKKCGKVAWERCSMHKEKSGPKLASETLSLRGDEMKFLGSLEQKVFLNGVNDD